MTNHNEYDNTFMGIRVNNNPWWEYAKPQGRPWTKPRSPFGDPWDIPDIYRPKPYDPEAEKQKQKEFEQMVEKLSGILIPADPEIQKMEKQIRDLKARIEAKKKANDNAAKKKDLQAQIEKLTQELANLD